MGTIIPFPWGYSGWNYMVNIGLVSIIANILTSQHTGIFVSHSYLFLFCLAPFIAIMSASTITTTKIVDFIASIIFSVTKRTMISRPDISICTQPNMAQSAFPIGFRAGIFRHWAKPFQIRFLCNSFIIRFAKTKALGTTFTPSNTLVFRHPNMILFASPVCFYIRVFGHWAKPLNVPLLCNNFVVRFGEFFMPRTLEAYLSTINIFLHYFPYSPVY